MKNPGCAPAYQVNVGNYYFIPYILQHVVVLNEPSSGRLQFKRGVEDTRSVFPYTFISVGTPYIISNASCNLVRLVFCITV